MLFAKRAPVLTTSNGTAEELQEVTQSLYKQNLELADRNKTLSVLGKLYALSIQTLESRELAQQITAAIQSDFEYERVGILQYDSTTDTISVLGFTESARFHEARAVANDFFENHSIIKATANEFFGKVISTQQMQSTDSFESVWGSSLSAEQIQKVQSEGHAHGLIAYPLIIEERIRGFFVITLNRTYKDLSVYEQESLQSFINVISLALDKARLYEELTISNQKLEQANKQQVVLIHFITHQIKGFVTKSRNIFSMMLEGDFGVLPDTMRPMVEEGFRSDTQGATTIQEILNASNVKSGSVTYTMAPMDFGILVTTIAENLRPNAAAKKLDFTVDVQGGPYQIVGDHLQLENAIKNIIDNSIKYTQSGSVAIKVLKEGNVVRFTEQDTGVGITPEDMQHLFTEGGHGTESIKINVESTGFGLYIVKNIIDAHKGKVWAESEGAGKGSKFTIELPISQA